MFQPPTPGMLCPFPPPFTPTTSTSGIPPPFPNSNWMPPSLPDTPAPWLPIHLPPPPSSVCEVSRAIEGGNIFQFDVAPPSIGNVDSVDNAPTSQQVGYELQSGVCNVPLNVVGSSGSSNLPSASSSTAVPAPPTNSANEVKIYIAR